MKAFARACVCVWGSVQECAAGLLMKAEQEHSDQFVQLVIVVAL